MPQLKSPAAATAGCNGDSRNDVGSNPDRRRHPASSERTEVDGSVTVHLEVLPKPRVLDLHEQGPPPHDNHNPNAPLGSCWCAEAVLGGPGGCSPAPRCCRTPPSPAPSRSGARRRAGRRAGTLGSSPYTPARASTMHAQHEPPTRRVSDKPQLAYGSGVFSAAMAGVGPRNRARLRAANCP